MVASLPLHAQQQTAKPRPQETEVWKAEPKVVTPGATTTAAPSDALVRAGRASCADKISRRVSTGLFSLANLLCAGGPAREPLRTATL